jgi:putative phosphoribosyl transferase
MADAASLVEENVSIPVDGVHIDGHLSLPSDYSAVILFAHGSGSSRHSPRNRFVASALNEAGFGTFLLDLLTEAEEAERSNVFDIALLARRLVAATEWVRALRLERPPLIGYFGASTGAAAALLAASELGDTVGSVVSRGGRADLAGPALATVTAPTLLIVGSADPMVLDLNSHALHQLRAPARLEVVDGATHLFEEQGALEQVATLARDWFATTLAKRPWSDNSE